MAIRSVLVSDFSTHWLDSFGLERGRAEVEVERDDRLPQAKPKTRGRAAESRAQGIELPINRTGIQLQ